MFFQSTKIKIRQFLLKNQFEPFVRVLTVCFTSVISFSPFTQNATIRERACPETAIGTLSH